MNEWMNEERDPWFAGIWGDDLGILGEGEGPVQGAGWS